MDRERMVRLAREVVEDVDREECALQAACLVSSAAAGDFTPASDVDILMVAAEGEGQAVVRRRLIEGTVFEWMVVGKADLADVDAILRDAGLVHDILTAVILRDDDGWITGVQSRIASRYREPETVWSRTAGQLDRIRGAGEKMRLDLEEGRVLSAQRSHVSVLKGALGLPRAILNRRCTMSRGFLFCREAVAELGWGGYMADVTAVFGVENIDRACAVELDALARRIVGESSFADEEKAIRTQHLGQSRWLLDHGEPSDAVWPLYFWSGANVEEAGGERNASCWRHWRRFAEVLGVADADGLQKRAGLAQGLVGSATALAVAYGRSHGLCSRSSRQDLAGDAERTRG